MSQRLRGLKDEKLTAESDVKETPVQEYDRRFAGMILEMSTLTKVAKMEELKGNVFVGSPVDNILYFLRHLGRLREDGT